MSAIGVNEVFLRIFFAVFDRGDGKVEEAGASKKGVQRFGRLKFEVPNWVI